MRRAFFHFRTFALHAALLALCLRALIPMGWMPNAGPGGPLTFCTVDGPVGALAMLDPHAHHHHHHSSNPDEPQSPHGDNHACPFALGVHSAGSSEFPTLPAVPLAWNDLPPTPFTALLQERDQHAPQSARGPPSLS